MLRYSRPRETAQRIERLLGFFGNLMLSAIDGELCRSYVRGRATEAAARRDLEELRAAIDRRVGLPKATYINAGIASSAPRYLNTNSRTGVFGVSTELRFTFSRAGPAVGYPAATRATASR